MFYCPPKYQKVFPNRNEELLNLKGELPTKQAQVTLAQFLRYNIGIGMELMSGVKLALFQEIILKGWLNRNFNMMVAGRGTSKCLDYSDKTFVLEKTAGLIPLTSLLPNVDFDHGEKWESIQEIQLWNGKGWCPVTKFLIQPQKSGKTVTTRQGYEISGSLNHRIKCINKDCEIIWKRLDEIQLGDYVCISRNEIPDGKDETENDIREARLVGLLIGDGCYTPSMRNSMRITSIDEEILSFCETFPVGIRQCKAKTTAKDLQFSTEFTSYFLNKYSIQRGLSYTKEIPQKILSSRKLLKACLQGIFDTDGCAPARGDIVTFSSVSQKLANQVHLALLSFGIISRKCEHKTPSPFGKTYLIQISGDNIEKFHNQIGFVLTRKKTALLAHLYKKKNTNVDTIPFYNEKITHLYRINKLKTNRKKYGRLFSLDQIAITYSKLPKYIQFLEDNNLVRDLELSKQIQSDNFFFSEVTKLESITSNYIDFNIPDGACYWGNGFINHNSFLAAVYCFLQTVFEPESKILIAGPTFRTARFIFDYLEKIVTSREGILAMQCFGGKKGSKRPDLFQWDINGGSIRAIPLNGEKIRGFRANILVLDEFLLLPKDIIDNVLMPFLVSPQNLKERLEIRELEDRLIQEGLLHESDKMVFQNTSKMIALSSASYKFENLYSTYMDWMDKIYDPKPAGEKTYFISQISWDSIPPEMIDPTIIQEAESGGSSSASFKREYCAEFVDDSDGYFKARKLKECTIPIGSEPYLKLRGDPDKKYIIAIDPNASNTPTADHFAMAIGEVDETAKLVTAVHFYAEAGRDLKDQTRYLFYLFKNFNIVFGTIDNAGGSTFIDGANESKIFQENGINFKWLDFDSNLEGEDYNQALEQLKRNHNVEAKRIFFKQVFTSQFIRKANEQLQASIDYKRIWFGSKLGGNDVAVDRILGQKIDLEYTGFESMTDFIDNQDILCELTKKECALIEVSTNPQGHQTFDLPQNLKRNLTENRARKDSYTALLLLNWATRIYFEMKDRPARQQQNTFIPRIV